MPYRGAMLTSTITVYTDDGAMDLPPDTFVLLLWYQEEYTLLGYFTNDGYLRFTMTQPISEDVLSQISQIPPAMSEDIDFMLQAANPQGPDDQMLELPEDIVVQVPEPEGLYRFRNINLRL